MTAGREHLAGLELFRDSTDKVLPLPLGVLLEDLIAKAIAAPEQEPVAWMHTYRCYPDDPRAPNQSGYEVTDFHQNPKAPGIESHTPLYTHADPSEVERLRAENAKLRGYCVSVDSEKREIEHKMDYYQGVQQELVEAKALLSAIRAAIHDSEVFCLPDSIVAALSATAQPAAPDSADEIPSFDPGNGNKARRRMEELGIAAKPAECRHKTWIGLSGTGHTQCADCGEPDESKEIWLDMDELPERDVGARYRMILDDTPQVCVEIEMEGTEKRWFRGEVSGAYPIDEVQAWLPADEVKP